LADGITGFGWHYRFGVYGLTSFICLWCNKNSSHRKKSAFLPYVTLYDETKVAVRLRYPQTAQEITESLILNSNHSRTSFAA